MLKLLMSSSFDFDGTAESDDEVEVIEAARRDADGRAEKAVASLASDSSSRASADFIMVRKLSKDFVVMT